LFKKQKDERAKGRKCHRHNPRSDGNLRKAFLGSLAMRPGIWIVPDLSVPRLSCALPGKSIINPHALHTRFAFENSPGFPRPGCVPEGGAHRHCPVATSFWARRRGVMTNRGGRAGFTVGTWNKNIAVMFTNLKIGFLRRPDAPGVVAFACRCCWRGWPSPRRAPRPPPR